MTPDQERLVLALAVARGEAGAISQEEFLRRFGELDGSALGRRLVAESIDDQDADGLELALIVVFTFGVTPDLCEPLIQVASAEWHHSHEDVVALLQELGDERAIPVLTRLTEWAPGELGQSEAETLAVAAMWAMAKIGGEESRHSLALIRDNSAHERMQELAHELLSRV